MELMTLQELASYLRVTTKTIYRLLEAQSIPAKKVGRQWRFDKDSIDTWLSQESEKKAAKINPLNLFIIETSLIIQPAIAIPQITPPIKI